MKQVILYTILFISVINIPSALSRQRIAYSKRYGAEIYVGGKNKEWCDDIIYLDVIVKNEDFFASPDFAYIISKTGKKIIEERECPKANFAGIKAKDAKGNKIHNFIATKEGDWIPHKVKDNRISLKERESLYIEDEDFSISGWYPLKGDLDVVVYPENVFEHEIETKDGSCAIRYSLLKPQSKVEKWHLINKGGDCRNYYLSGKSEIRILNENDHTVHRGIGYFSKGYFTDNKQFDVQFMDRYAYGYENQRLNFLIDSDPINQIHYVGFLKSNYRKKYERYTKWHGCDPFTIAAVTENRDLFLDDRDIEALVDAAKDYAKAYCPNTLTISLFAVRKPRGIYGLDIPEISNDNNTWQEDPDFLYSTTIKRDPLNGIWTDEPKKARNRIRYEEVIKNAEKVITKDNLSTEYHHILESPYIKKLSYMYGVNNLDNLNAVLIASSLNDNSSIYVNFMVNVAFSDGLSSKAYYPIPISINCKDGLLCEPGWYLTSGYVVPLSKEEKEIHGFKDSRFAANFIPENAFKCSENFCNEALNVLTLVRQKHFKPDFIPERNP